MGWLVIKKSPLSYQASDPQASYFQASDRLGSLDHYFFGETVKKINRGNRFFALFVFPLCRFKSFDK